MSPDDLTIIRYRLGKAVETLNDLHKMQKAQVAATTIVSRAYYGAFYAVLACLQSKQLAPRSHRSAIELFDREFVHSRIFSKAHSTALHELFHRRQVDDYTRLEPTPAEDAGLSIEQAQFFISSVLEHFRAGGSEPENFTERPKP